MHGTDSHTLTAAVTQLFVDHVNTLCILLDRTLLTGTRTLSALDTGVCLGISILSFHDLNTGFVRIKFFVESHGTGSDTFQT